MKIFPGLSYSLACQARTKIWVWSVLLLSIKHPQRINFFSNFFLPVHFTLLHRKREGKKVRKCTAFSPYYVHFHFFFIAFFCIKQVHLFPFSGSLNIDLVGISEYSSLRPNWQTRQACYKSYLQTKQHLYQSHSSN